ncbi:MAG: arginyltransferase [Sphingomonadaceae bacterium]|nr:arginyltransferase [Sphingomonadaceae bacterium]
MSDLSYRFPRFFVTTSGPCPYLPGRTERKLFTELRGPDAGKMAVTLAQIGFRRSQNVVYRPSCDGCQACVSVRVPVEDFAASATQRRLLKRNADLTATVRAPWTTAEQFLLLRSYLSERHPNGGMASMDALDYADMVEQTPVDTVVIEYRDSAGKLVAAALTDQHPGDLSMIYSFYDPAEKARGGLGTFIILDHIRRAAAEGRAHVYLGYWIQNAPRMAYKTAFRPIERLTRAGWVREASLPAPARPCGVDAERPSADAERAAVPHAG